MKPDTPVQTRPLRPLLFALLSAAIGIVAGLGAVVFRALIGGVHNLAFLGQWSTAYDANAHTPPSPWGIGVILVPVVGAVIVAFIVKNFAPEAKGHGVPEVMDAIYYNRGRIRPVVALVKSLASAVSIGTGGSVGREGPIIQIGSSFGSTIGQLLRVPAWQRITLIAGGAGAGIAATFNTPVGGVLFVLETMMHEISVRTIVPVAIATAMATYVGRLYFGPHPSFVVPGLEVPSFHATNPYVLLAYAALGVLMGGVAALFIRSIYATEDFFDQRIGGSYYRRHLLGMFLVGLVIYGLMATRGHYYVDGVGYSTVQDILAGTPLTLTLLVTLFAMKLLATALTLGSGASGGIFSPALFLGATFGAAYGIVGGILFPSLAFSAPAFALAGMAGLVGGATSAAMASIVMIFEMTLDYNVIVPMTITVAISYGVRRVLCHESIYTMKLVRRGHFLPEALRTGPQFVRRANEISLTKFGPLPAATTLAEFARLVSADGSVPCFLVVDEGKPVGFVRSASAIEVLRDHRDGATLGEIAEKRFFTISGLASLYEVISEMHARGASLALVAGEGGAVTGVISRERVADAVIESAELFRD
ncbi:MAG TPA: chloride channel protein [Opitutus sp.]|nr:chloride channel protein [Opitutus sp.]